MGETRVRVGVDGEQRDALGAGVPQVQVVLAADGHDIAHPCHLPYLPGQRVRQRLGRIDPGIGADRDQGRPVTGVGDTGEYRAAERRRRQGHEQRQQWKRGGGGSTAGTGQ